MEEELEKYRNASLYYCNKLLNDIKRTQEDIGLFFGGDLYKAYDAATDKALSKAIQVRTKLRNL